MFKGPFVRSAYNYDMDEASEVSGLKCMDKSLCQQEFADECDINTIVRRFGLTGELPQSVMVPFNADFEGVVDFKSAMNLIVASQEAFMEMPADVRARFGNDPAKFVDFASDERNRSEAARLGLLVSAVASLAVSDGLPKDLPVSPPAAPKPVLDGSA